MTASSWLSRTTRKQRVCLPSFTTPKTNNWSHQHALSKKDLIPKCSLHKDQLAEPTLRSHMDHHVGRLQLTEEGSSTWQLCVNDKRLRLLNSRTHSALMRVLTSMTKKICSTLQIGSKSFQTTSSCHQEEGNFLNLQFVHHPRQEGKEVAIKTGSKVHVTEDQRAHALSWGKDLLLVTLIWETLRQCLHLTAFLLLPKFHPLERMICLSSAKTRMKEILS